MSNINQKVSVISTLQASGADVSSSGGMLSITGVEKIKLSNIQKGGSVASLHGLAAVNTITSTAAVAGATTYSQTIKQTIDSKTYVYSYEYTTPTAAPSAAAFYASLALKIQEGITGNQLLGSVTSSGIGTVFTGTVDAPIGEFVSDGLSVASPAAVLTAAGSSCTNAAPRVLTAGAAHGLTLNKIYSFTISGVTGAGAADLNRTLYGIPLAATTITLLGTTATGTVTTTSATLTINNTGDETFANTAGGITGFISTDAYVGVEISALSLDAVDAGSVLPYVVLANSTGQPTANVNAFLNALIVALAGTPAEIG